MDRANLLAPLLVDRTKLLAPLLRDRTNVLTPLLIDRIHLLAPLWIDRTNLLARYCPLLGLKRSSTAAEACSATGFGGVIFHYCVANAAQQQQKPDRKLVLEGPWPVIAIQKHKK